MEQSAELSVIIEDTGDQDVGTVNRELQQWINQTAPGCRATPVTQAGQEGSKGVLEVLNSLKIMFEGMGALDSLIECLATYIKERRKTVKLTIAHKDGRSITLQTENLGQRDVAHLLSQLQEVSGATKEPVS